MVRPAGTASPKIISPMATAVTLGCPTWRIAPTFGLDWHGGKAVCEQQQQQQHGTHASSPRGVCGKPWFSTSNGLRSRGVAVMMTTATGLLAASATCEMRDSCASVKVMLVASIPSWAQLARSGGTHEPWSPHSAGCAADSGVTSGQSPQQGPPCPRPLPSPPLLGSWTCCSRER